MVDMLKILSKVPLFEMLSLEELQKIEEVSEVKGYQEGKQLFEEGDIGDTFYVVLIGKVKIYRDNKYIATFEKGDSFGELAIIDQEPRSATARIIEDSVLLSLSREVFLNFLRNNPDVTIKILEIVCKRLRKTNDNVSGLSAKVSKTLRAYR
ncbi:MAG TPA: cyclic nucleotide-binding domain-containing protein [Bacillus bacterium]|nr:cyclic nucleotide-binding domain-containing protein [Bacillus sp. (in: firmicutes)]